MEPQGKFCGDSDKDFFCLILKKKKKKEMHRESPLPLFLVSHEYRVQQLVISLTWGESWKSHREAHPELWLHYLYQHPNHLALDYGII